MTLPMLKTVLFLLLGVSAGFVFATLLGDRPGLAPDVSYEPLDTWRGSSSTDELLPLAKRLDRLEAGLDVEIALRQSLQAELAAIIEQMTNLQAGGSERDRQDDPRLEVIDRAAIQERFAARFADRADNGSDRRLNQLVEAGFSPDQALHITERESELQLEALYAQYDAIRDGEPSGPLTNRFDQQDQLRQELGDASYERYLDATGQSTSIGVQRVMDGSPGQAAGLQTGDEVIAYAGERVFNISDLNQLILEGAPGQPVVMDVLRDGQQIQLYVPRGPIGITGGRGGGMGGGR
jgi:predicted metalloprotease with PDZ domain